MQGRKFSVQGLYAIGASKGWENGSSCKADCAFQTSQQASMELSRQAWACACGAYYSQLM